MSRVREFFDALERETGESYDRDLNSDFVNLAVNVGRIRRDRGMTQAKLAEAVGISQPRIAEIEGAQANPTFKTLVRLARGLDTDVSALVAEEHEYVHVGSYNMTCEALHQGAEEYSYPVLWAGNEAANSDLAQAA